MSGVVVLQFCTVELLLGVAAPAGEFGFLLSRFQLRRAAPQVGMFLSLFVSSRSGLGVPPMMFVYFNITSCAVALQKALIPCSFRSRMVPTGSASSSCCLPPPKKILCLARHLRFYTSPAA
jgi:hypothetical protein